MKEKSDTRIEATRNGETALLEEIESHAEITEENERVTMRILVIRRDRKGTHTVVESVPITETLEREDEKGAFTEEVTKLAHTGREYAIERKGTNRIRGDGDRFTSHSRGEDPILSPKSESE